MLAVVGGAPVSAAAAAAPSQDPAKLAAVVEKDPQTGNAKRYPVGRGEVIPAVIGVTNIGPDPVKGLVVRIRVVDDYNFATKYQNCWYGVDSNAQTAYCSFDTALAADATLAIVDPVVAMKPDARPDKVSSIVFTWLSQDWVDTRGGVQALADGDSRPGKAVRGTDGTLALTSRSLPLGEEPHYATGFVAVELVLPHTTAPTQPATPTPTASASSAAPTAAAPTSAAPGGAGGGGLAVTGTQTATVAGIGALLLLVGAVGFVIARRRRTRFVP